MFVLKNWLQAWVLLISMLLRRWSQRETHLSVILAHSETKLVNIVFFGLLLKRINGCRIRMNYTLIREHWSRVLWPVWSCEKIIVIHGTLTFFLRLHIIVILKLTKSRRRAGLITRRTRNYCWGGLESFANRRHYLMIRKHRIFILIYHWIIRLIDIRLLLLKSINFRSLVFIRKVRSSRINNHFIF